MQDEYNTGLSGLQKQLEESKTANSSLINNIQNFGGAKKNAVAMQDKTGSYGQKRKPGDYLR